MKVAVVMGSDSDFPILKPAVDLLHQFNVETEVIVASAHRTPGKVRDLVSSAEERGVGAFIFCRWCRRTFRWSYRILYYFTCYWSTN